MNLDPSQSAVAASKRPHLLVVAGPGSGKTRTLIATLGALIESGVNPAGIALVTYTNAAADEIVARIRSEGILPEDRRPRHAGTLHGLILRTLQRHGRRIGLPGDLAVMSEAAEEELVGRVIADLRVRVPRKKVDEAMKEGPLAISQKAADGYHLTEAELAAAQAFRRMIESGLLTFDLILALGNQLLLAMAAGGENPGEVLGITHLLVDEFQDASPLDASIYRALAPEWSLFVGDPDQSIFGFRGADVRQIVEEARRREVHLLELNYRSTWNICRAAQGLIARNRGRVDKVTRPADETREGRSVRSVFRIEGQERAAIIREVNGLIEGGLPPNEIALLLRTNWLVGEWAKALEAVGIPVVKRVVAAPPAGWEDAMRLLTLLSCPDNDFLAEWFLERRDGRATADRERKKALASLRSINSTTLGLPRIVDLWEGPGITRALSELALAGIDREAVSKIEETAFAAARSVDTLPDLILRLRGVGVVGEEEGEVAGVTVTTYHSAKGREWEVVFMPSFDGEGVAATEEERRLVFVAMTRPKSGLAVTSALVRSGKFTRNPEPVKPHPFDGEIDLERVEPGGRLLHPAEWLRSPSRAASEARGGES